MPRLADQQAQPYHAQVASLALGVPSPGQFAGRLCVDVGVEIGCIERQHVRGQLEAGDGGPRDGHLRLLQLLVAHLLGDAMKGLAGERAARQTRHARQTRVEKLAQLALGSGCAGALNRHGHRQLAYRGAAFGAHRAACPIDLADQVQLLGHPNQRADITDTARAHGLGRTQIHHWRWIDRPEHDLPCDAAPALGVPHGLRRDAVAAAFDLSLENVHSFMYHLQARESSENSRRYATLRLVVGPGQHRDLRR